MEHQLWKTGDPNAPDVILDNNKEVVLQLCKICGKGEAELREPCTKFYSFPEVLKESGVFKSTFKTLDYLALQIEERSFRIVIVDPEQNNSVEGLALDPIPKSFFQSKFIKL